MYDVSILLPCRNEGAFIVGCLRSITEQQGLSDKSEILVIDGMSDDRTRELVLQAKKSDSRIKLIDNPKGHVSPALNIGIRAARNDIIVRMDAHTEYAEDYISTCVEVLAETGADNVGGPARTKAKGYVQEAVRLSYHEPLVVGGARFHDVDYEGEVDTVTYGCWYRCKLVEIGLFDENLIRNQDDELNLRIVKQGGVVWQSPRIKSWYWPRSTLRNVATQYYQYGYWKIYVINKHRQPASWRHLVPGAFVGGMLFSALLAPFLPMAAAMSALALAVYLLFVIAATLRISLRAKTMRYFLILPAIVMSFQLPYGLGFLVGWFDALFHRQNRSSTTGLSR